MKAIVLREFGSADVMSMDDVEKPRAGDSQVRVKVLATSVNRPDIVQREGNYPPPKGDSEILGLEVAGVIDELGPNVKGWSVGDRVMSLVGGGGYAEFALAYADHFTVARQAQVRTHDS